MQEHCVPFAGDDVAYSHAPAEHKNSREFRWLQRALAGAPHGIHQGIYLVTSSGKFLQKVDSGWPHYDPALCLQNLRRGVTAFEQLPTAERTLQQPFTRSDAMPQTKPHFEVPDGALDLAIATRSMPYPEADLFDIRHPKFLKTDRMILTREEQRALLPAELDMGATHQAPAALAQRFLLHNHLTIGCDPWWPEHFQQASLTTTVTSQSPTETTLTVRGKWKAKANSKWNQGNYQGSMLGTITVTTASRQITHVEWLALGHHHINHLKPNMHRQPNRTPVGMLATINTRKDLPPPTHR
ncbi:hypothetical protein [Sulfuriroseicoccus oceanibius]|uniref:Uncharacterized protein n=1 Tax=Sulfuriroseicoccus oceanibius TaxID=2707525 RepID=A0A6B3L7U5_9BACT|nr:hypothetical protein [Sulfuriroseicoccus oceanibius]QQL44763.1 hypothetical protein G3M56_012915 [Sulfuriroseicoccus oceanibius]